MKFLQNNVLFASFKPFPPIREIHVTKRVIFKLIRERKG
jgi:hypothetical protein